jgi:hypothetical protein
MNSSGFSPRVVLGLVLFGAFAFIAFLWMVGSGMADRNPDPEGAHAAGKGLSGYAALAQYMDKRGWEVSQARSRGALKQGGLLVLTPLHWTDPDEIEAAVKLHRPAGPTVVIMPKWLTATLPRQTVAVKEGWVTLLGADLPKWEGFHDEIAVDLSPMRGQGKTAAWSGAGLAGALPVSEKVASGGGEDLVALVEGEQDGRMLAAYQGNDGGDTDGLDAIALEDGIEPGEDSTLHPLIFVFEPDLLNNYGFSDLANARLAERIALAAIDGGEKKLIFDLTLPGYGRSENLLTLAFTPPFLAATLCLLLAAAVLLWRALNRFGPPLAAGRSIAFGKRALVANAAGLVRRARRLHLVGPPYADAARERLDPAEAEKAIDIALVARAPDAHAFSAASAAMRAARRPAELLRAAQTLHSLERILTR